MNSSKEATPRLIDLLIKAARNEDWKYVDDNINGAAGDETALRWADNFGLEDRDEHLRDLASSLFERSDERLPDGVPDKLLNMIKTSSGKYDRFRAACALSKHGYVDPEVTAVLSEFADDEDQEVVDIARKYL
jgi:hypothetical protein